MQIDSHYKLLPNGESGQEALVIEANARLSGFQSDTGGGTGTYTIEATIFCSELGKPTIRDSFTLVDKFNQQSEEMFADTSIDYSACSESSVPQKFNPRGVLR